MTVPFDKRSFRTATVLTGLIIFGFVVARFMYPGMNEMLVLLQSIVTTAFVAYVIYEWMIETGKPRIMRVK